MILGSFMVQSWRMDTQDTIAAISTPPGRGGVAVVRVSGPEAFAIASRLAGRPLGAAQAGRFFHATFRRSGHVLDDGLVLVFSAPRSYTGEDVVELGFNGRMFLIRRGEEVCLPEPLIEILEHAGLL